MSTSDDLGALYAFVYRGVLADEALDRVGRRRNRHLSVRELERLKTSLSVELLDEELLADSRTMASVYTVLHTFENMVRSLVRKVMAEAYEEDWWSHVPEKVRKRVATRMSGDAKFRWHGNRGANEITYLDFGDLASIIDTNWEHFTDLLVNLEWVKQILGTLEKSRNVVMHGGVLEQVDIERIGMNIRDWIRQSG